MPLSFTFIPALLSDNPILEQKDPGYRAKLLALPLVDRERLLGGNWKVRPSAGKVFNRDWFEIVHALPVDCDFVRYWDKAATEDGGAMTAGVKMGRCRSTGLFYIADVQFGQLSSMRRENLIKQLAALDGTDVRVVTEQEPGSGGKESAEGTVRNLAGWDVRADKVTGDKFERAGPMSAQAEARNIKMLYGDWNEETLRQLHRFAPGRELKDIADAAVGAFNNLARGVQLPPGGIVMEGLTRESPWLN
jgi:predicted phage terminase large subunit-like protein